MKQAERWLKYRDNRNNTAHDYGKKFAEVTLTLLKRWHGAQCLSISKRTSLLDMKRFISHRAMINPEYILLLLPDFITDATALEKTVRSHAERVADD